IYIYIYIYMYQACICLITSLHVIKLQPYNHCKSILQHNHLDEVYHEASLKLISDKPTYFNAAVRQNQGFKKPFATAILANIIKIPPNGN
ncbi:hypothetical protein D0Y65_038967, partial [Glycine soja]